VPELLDSIDGVACRACGAVRAPRGPYDGLCGTCWRKIGYSDAKEYTGSPEQDAQINLWLARKLELDLRHLDKFRVTGRCEALSQRNEWTGERLGYQCGRKAITTRDGFKVCHQHKFSPAPHYINSPSSDPYADIGSLVERLCRIDRRLRKTLREAIGA
jgi:hypothetical protein